MDVQLLPTGLKTIITGCKYDLAGETSPKLVTKSSSLPITLSIDPRGTLHMRLNT